MGDNGRNGLEVGQPNSCHSSLISIRNHYLIFNSVGMSSESDVAIESDVSTESEDMALESDEELLNSESPKTEKETVTVKKHKKSYDPRFAAPSFEERQMMRDADMKVEISMLEMEVSLFCLGGDGNRHSSILTI